MFVTRVKFSSAGRTCRTGIPLNFAQLPCLRPFLFGSGDKWDESKFKAYPAGTFYSEPPKAAHFTWAKDGDVIIQITGVGFFFFRCRCSALMHS